MTKTKKTGAVWVLIFAYGVLAFAALGRSSFELATKFSAAPLPYTLSAIAACFYVLATIALIRQGSFWRKLATWILSFELALVLVIGFATIFDANAFPAKTVWSNFGQGYGFVPIALPILGLIWLRRGEKK